MSARSVHPRSTRRQAVLPTISAPHKVGGHEFIDRDAGDKVVEGPLGGHMSDDEQATAIPARREIIENLTCPDDGLAPPLAAGKRIIEVPGRIGDDDFCSLSV